MALVATIAVFFEAIVGLWVGSRNGTAHDKTQLRA
jgi:hypothetical protein